MIYCEEGETQKHLLVDCYRAQEVWSILKGLGLDIDIVGGKHANQASGIISVSHRHCYC